MKQETRRELINGFCSAFIESNDDDADQSYVPSFLYNDKEKGKKLLTTIEDELRSCTSFDISVAFITTGGIQPLLLTLQELEEKGIHGKILTTDYLSFSEPAAIRKLASFSNIEVRLYTCTTDTGFHTKGYIFKNADVYHVILGSSNWTAKALTVNHEWNTRLISAEEGPFLTVLRSEFNELWKKSRNFDDAIDAYETQWSIAKRVRAQAQKLDVDSNEQKTFNPNKMQEEFVKNISELSKSGKKRALLISATGTGKTFAAAFAARELKPKRILFLVHRQQIAEQAKTSFEKVLLKQYRSYGLLSGTNKDYESDCLFATMQTMAKKETLSRFSKNHFQLIIIDEVHHAEATSYKKIMAHFDPDFWLGMTATPERADGFSICSIFNNNIAYEIRLEKALTEDMLCPFHYFGITDITVNGKVLNDLSSFKKLVSDERVNHIIKNAKFYGHSGARVQGLIFCSRINECEELSKKFNNQGFQTIALSAQDSPSTRQDAVNRLRQINKDGNSLDYIFTVDLFNEGVDIPEINQVILLRPTESPIIFVQQLGRGLRKADNKDFVVVLDFIGNYQNNFLIPAALSGDMSGSRSKLRRAVHNGTSLIPGATTIHFDEITRRRIYQSIDNAKLQTAALLKESYRVLKQKLGYQPSLIDFELHNSIDVTKLFDYSGSYYSFLKKYDNDFRGKMSVEAEEMLCFISKELGKAQRISEIIVLEGILNGQTSLLNHLRSTLANEYHITSNQRHENNVFAVLTNQFQVDKNQTERHKNCIFIEHDGRGEWRSTHLFESTLKKEPTFVEFLKELITFAKKRYSVSYSERYKETDLVLNMEYAREDVCRLLNWSKRINGQNIGGYKYDEETKTLPVFINYHKTDGAIQFEDHFKTNQELIALSKTPRKVNSKDADHIYKLKPEDAENRIFLFVQRGIEEDKNKKKKKVEKGAFYFLGEIEATGKPEATHVQNKGKAFKINYKLLEPVRQDIYEYLTTEILDEND